MDDIFIYRKELASKLNVSRDTVRRLEASHGLAAARDKVFGRARYYRNHTKVRALLEAGTTGSHL